MAEPDRKSTRLNSSHLVISYAVFCLKKKNTVIAQYAFRFPQEPPLSQQGDGMILRKALAASWATCVCVAICALHIAAATASTPFCSTAVVLPGTIEAENFDDGGQLVAYYDTTTGNKGGVYRATDVDL